MDSATRLAVALDGSGRSTVAELRAEVPLLVRTTSADPLRVHLVGGSAGPLGGDRTHLHLSIGAGSTLIVRSAGASLVMPGAHGEPSTADVVAELADRASLDWWPEPTVAVHGCDHTMTTRLLVHADATVRWVEVVVLGRAGETAGRLVAHQHVTLGDRPLLRHTLRFAAPGQMRVVVSAVVVGAPSGSAASCVDRHTRAVRCPLTPTATSWTGVGDDVAVVLGALADLGLHPDGV